MYDSDGGILKHAKSFGKYKISAVINTCLQEAVKIVPAQSI